MPETRHMQPGGSWFGLFRCSRGQAVFGEVIWRSSISPTTTDNFRHNMQKVAAEERCAFFDMTDPWWAYIRNSGKTYGWFMGDRVHANHRGCQIIGRLLESWFKT